MLFTRLSHTTSTSNADLEHPVVGGFPEGVDRGRNPHAGCPSGCRSSQQRRLSLPWFAVRTDAMFVLITVILSILNDMSQQETRSSAIASLVLPKNIH